MAEEHQITEETKVNLTIKQLITLIVAIVVAVSSLVGVYYNLYSNDKDLGKELIQTQKDIEDLKKNKVGRYELKKVYNTDPVRYQPFKELIDKDTTNNLNNNVDGKE